MDNTGASFGPGSRAAHEARSGLHPTGFDPSRGLHILQHSLGVDRHGQGERYRNHFVTGEGSVDYPDCMALVGAGLMERRGYSALAGGDWCFTVTEAGAAYVAEHSPPPPKLTAGQRRYREWLDVSDATGETFIEFCRRKAASAIKARRAETGTGSVHESAVGDSRDAQPAPASSQTTIQEKGE